MVPIAIYSPHVCMAQDIFLRSVYTLAIAVPSAHGAALSMLADTANNKSHHIAVNNSLHLRVSKFLLY